MEKNTCKETASFRYTWPGNDESIICQGHSIKLRFVAEAIGMNLQVIPITTDKKCRQEVLK